jgi:ubiquinone/menaquinone biosynthesis C-methylase UbiE
MDRILEPELMEEYAQVVAYADADFEQPHNDFIERLKTVIDNPAFCGKALDLGCGPGDISRRFLGTYPNAEVHAVDGSKLMLEHGLLLTDPQLVTKLQYIHGRLPEVELPETSYDVIFSNSLLHHLPDPMILWDSVKKFGRTGSKIIVMDLLRPSSDTTAKEIVEIYASEEPEILQRDFYQSLLAAFTLDEIGQQLEKAGLTVAVEQISDRHVFIVGTLG